LVSCGEVLSDLLSKAQNLKLLVTSRERLNLPGEWVMEVLGLSYPGNKDAQAISQYPAAHLFLKMAERASGFQPAPSDWPAITRICQYLEGIPLGIEMAAAWTRLLSCHEIAGEVEKSLDFLSSNWRGMPERHRTIRAVFEYSWTLLSDQEQRAVCGLSLFKGGFDREAALAVTGMTLQVLSALMDKSLVHRQSSGRYEIHPLLNQYAAEKLASDTELTVRFMENYTDYYVDWISRLNHKLKGGTQLEALNTLRKDAKNLISLWQWLVSKRDYERLKQVVPTAIAYYELHNRYSETTEMTRLLKDSIAILELECGDESLWRTDPFADLLSLSMAAFRHFSFPTMGEKALSPIQRKSVQIAQSLPDGPLKALSLVINASGPGDVDIEEALQLLRQSMAIYQRLDDSWGMALASLVFGDTSLFGNDDLRASWEAYQSSLSLFEAAGNEWGQGKCLYGMATIRQKEGQMYEALSLGERSLAMFERLNSMDSIYYCRMTLAEIAENLGQVAVAREHYQRLLAYYHQAGNSQAQAYFLDRIAKLDKMEYHQSSYV
jgi:predicted ATPase